MDRSAEWHPAVLLGYYAAAFMLLLMIGHPALLAVTAGLMFLNRLLQAGARRALRSLCYGMGILFACLIVNPLFNHRGVTLLFRLGGMRITREAVLYGGHMALLLSASLLLFACFSQGMTSGKIMSLTGKRMPAFSLLFTMVLRIAPKVRHDFRQMTELHGSRPKVWSALLGVVLEDSAERSISLKYKGYGKKGRSHYFEQEWRIQDRLVLLLLCAAAGYFLWRLYAGIPTARYFPSIHIDAVSRWEWCLYVCYMGMPVWLRGKEEVKWFLWKRRITDSIIRNRKSRRFI